MQPSGGPAQPSDVGNLGPKVSVVLENGSAKFFAAKASQGRSQSWGFPGSGKNCERRMHRSCEANSLRKRRE